METSLSLTGQVSMTSSVVPGSSGASPNLPHQEIPFLSAIELEVFSTAVKNYKIHGKLIRDDAISLNWVFGTSIKQVLDMIDDDCVTIMKSPASGKVIAQVYGQSGGEVYWVPPGTSTCQCPVYVRWKKEYCKHVLAAHFVLAIASPDEYEDISELELKGIFDKHFNKSTLK